MTTFFKWISRLVGIIIILSFIIGVVSYIIIRGKTVPDINTAPWAIQTYSTDGMHIPSRIYYAKEVRMLDDGTPEIMYYWTLDGTTYHYHNSELDFPVDRYGQVSIIKR